MEIRKENALYEHLFNKWKAAGEPRYVESGRVRYLIVYNDGEMYFVEVGASAGIDNRYGGNSFR